MFKQNEKAISQIAEYIPRACRGMQLQEAKARLEKKIELYTDDGCDVAVIVGAIDCGKEFCEQLREGADK
ncbi:TPA: hypothetical protein L9A86_005140 [Klebsiella pneumoniae]|nr:hypothetical protein [Klebsiella pneumoniae]HBQ8752309.1 hypothetical protein [Klebsiella pneumoniae]